MNVLIYELLFCLLVITYFFLKGVWFLVSLLGFARLFWSAKCVFLTRSLICSSDFMQISCFPLSWCLWDSIEFGEEKTLPGVRVDVLARWVLVLSSDSKMFFDDRFRDTFLVIAAIFWFPLSRFEWSFILLLNGSYFNFSFGSFVAIKILSDLLGFLFTVFYVNFTLEWFD